MVLSAIAPDTIVADVAQNTKLNTKFDQSKFAYLCRRLTEIHTLVSLYIVRDIRYACSAFLIIKERHFKISLKAPLLLCDLV